MHVLQVKDKEGKWVNVDLKTDEVAVLLGATLHHCTAGLLRPSLYRVVRTAVRFDCMGQVRFSIYQSVYWAPRCTADLLRPSLYCVVRSHFMKSQCLLWIWMFQAALHHCTT